MLQWKNVDAYLMKTSGAMSAANVSAAILTPIRYVTIA